MSKNRRPRPRQPATPSPPANRRPPIWAAGILVLALAGVAAVLVYYFHNGGDGDAVASSPAAGPQATGVSPAAAAGTALSEAQRRTLVGRWRAPTPIMCWRSARSPPTAESTPPI